MGNITDTPAYGGSGGDPFRNVCPSGSYLSEISGNANDRVRRICGKCSDGTTLQCQGTESGNAFNYQGPFDYVSVSSGEWLDRVYNSGGMGGNPHEMRCPTGGKVVGLYGRSGIWLDQLGAVCGEPTNKPTTVNITNTDPYGGSGGAPFGNKCPSGSYLSEIYGNADDRVRRICGKCSDGTTLQCQGDEIGAAFSYPGPFDYVSVRSGDWIDQVYNSGGMGGSPHEMRCPAGGKVIGLYGRSGSWIDQLGAACGTILQPLTNAISNGVGNNTPTPAPPLPPSPNTNTSTNTSSTNTSTPNTNTTVAGQPVPGPAYTNNSAGSSNSTPNNASSTGTLTDTTKTYTNMVNNKSGDSGGTGGNLASNNTSDADNTKSAIIAFLEDYWVVILFVVAIVCFGIWGFTRKTNTNVNANNNIQLQQMQGVYNGQSSQPT